MTRPVYIVVLRWCAVVLSLLVASQATFAQTFSEAGFSAETIAQVTRFNTVGFVFARFRAEILARRVGCGWCAVATRSPPLIRQTEPM